MARHTLRTGLIVGLIVSAAMPLIGHWSAVEVAKYQPIKMAAFENVWRDRGPRAAVPLRLDSHQQRRRLGRDRHLDPERPEPDARVQTQTTS